MNAQEIEELVIFLQDCKESYYNGTPIVSDQEFDELEMKLKKFSPNNQYFTKVGIGSVSTGDVTIQHFFPMLSMNKDIPLHKWYRSNNIPDDTEILIEPKIDGISGSIIYDNGIISYGLTRGDGRFGKLIKFIGKIKVDGIPNKIPEKNGRVEIRGEFYISVKYANTVFKDKPLRNCASGIIRSGEDIEYLSFVAYQRNIVDGQDDVNTEYEILKVLKFYGFKPTIFKLVSSIDEINNFIKDYIDTFRDSYDYETDGCVITINDRKLQTSVNLRKIVRKFNWYNLAIKPPSKTGKSKLIRFEFNVSKSGRLVPVLVFEPTIVANVEITNATMDNYGILKKYAPLYYGSTVYIKRANDVIPKVIAIDSDGNKNAPIQINNEYCPSCGSPLKIIKNPKSEVENLFCENTNCAGRKISIIYNWVERLEMKNVGYKFIEMAYNNDIIKSIEDLYDSKLESKLANIRGFVEGGNRINKIIEAIDSSTVGITDLDIINGVGIPGIGRISLMNYGITDINTIWDRIHNSEISHFAVCDYIRKWLSSDNNFEVLKNLKKILKSQSVKPEKSDGPQVCITGTFDIPRNKLVEILAKKGYDSSDSVTSKTAYLLVGDEPGGSKMNKAEKLGTKMIQSIDELP